MGGNGENLDDKVKSGELKEITPDVPEAPATPAPAVPPAATPTPAAEEPGAATPAPEVPSAPATPPAANLEGENRRLAEKNRKLEQQLKDNSAAAPAPAVPQAPPKPPEPVRVAPMSSYKWDDDSPEAETYWVAREQATGIDRKVLASQEETSLRAVEHMRKVSTAADKGTREALDYCLQLKPHAEQYRAEIEAMISPWGIETKSNTKSVMAAVKMVLGEHVGETPVAAPVTPKPPAPKPGSTTQRPGFTSVQNANPNKAVTLTAAEFKWATELNMFTQGFDNATVHEMYVRKHKPETKKE